MRKIPFALCALLLASASANATTYRAGLLQSKWSAANDWSTAIPLAGAERIPGVPMAHVMATESNYNSVGYENPWTGVTTYWNKQNTMFGYTGQMWMEAGKTYTFGKCLDDSVRIEIDGTQVMQHTTWDQFTTATFVPAFTGWHDVDIRVSDATGGKGPSNKNAWGTIRGLGWNVKGVTAVNLTDWNWFLEDGVTNRFRCATADLFAVESCTKTATGFDFTVTNLSDAAVSVAAFRSSSSDYSAVSSWPAAAGPVSVPANGTSTLSLATADETPAAYQVGTFGTGSDFDWFTQFVPFGPLGSMGVTGVEGQSVAASGIVTAFGEGADSARIRVEAAAGPGFSDVLAASEEAVIDTVDGTAALALDGLAFDTTYYLRLRIVTAAGTAYAPFADPVTTLEAPFASGKVYAAGLVQAKIGGSAMDKTTDILSHGTATNVPGAIMASTSVSAVNPYDGKTYSWDSNTTFGYVGQMWMTGGTTYWFGKYLDDSGLVKVDGTTVMDNGTYNALVTASFTPEKTGWHEVEFRFGNGTGGAGCMGSTIGFGYNTDDVSSLTADTFKDGGPWSKAVDPGDLSLFRCVYSTTPFMTVGNVAASGGDLVVDASFAGVPAGGGVLQALWGAGDGGYVTSSWAHVTTAGAVAAGDTASTSFTVPGAGSAAFVAFRFLDGGAGTPWVQWSQIYNLSAESPVFGLVSTGVDYTNLAYTASCSGLGAGASSVTASIEIATDAEFRNVERTVALDQLVGIGGQSVSLTGFTTNTTYYARVTGQNSEGETGASSPVIVTTLDPQPPEGTAAFAARGFTTLAGTALVSTFGTGSASATIRFEASADSFATLAGVSDEVAAAVGVGRTLTVPDLAPATAYNLRLRIVNEWGLTVYVPIDQAYSTRDVPVSASGIGYAFAPGGATVDVSFGVVEVFDGATCTATLSLGGTVVSSQTFSAAGPLVWSGLAASRSATEAAVEISAVVDGTTYTHVWTATVTPGTTASALTDLSQLAGVFFRAGDTATLPELAGASDYYVVMDVRSFSLGADGVTLTALEPGFSAVVPVLWDAASSAFVAGSPRALAVCIPEVEGAGRVFFAHPASGKMNWEDTSKWTNVTTGEADYPHLANDVAMAAIPNDQQLVLNASATVGELYIGPDEASLHKPVRLTGKNSATLTFARSSGKPGLLRFTGHVRNDTPVLSGGWNELRIGGGDGDSTTTGLGIEMPGGLDFDGGAWPDYTAWGTPEVDSFGRARYIMGHKLRYWNIPEGKTLHVVNTYGRNKMTGDDQGGNANFTWENNAQVTGKGTLLYDGASSTYIDNPFYAFEGTVAVRNKQKYDDFAFGSRGGSFWMVNWTRPSLVATNATLLVEGDVAYGSIGSSFGVVSYGNAHGYGSWGWTDNAFPAGKWIMNGGCYRSAAMNNNAASWREDGTTTTQPVCVPNGAGTLVVSNGFSQISMGQNGDADRPTNSLAFASLEHAGDGVLLVGTDRTYNSYQNNGAGASWRVRAVLGGFHGHAIGGTGHAASRHGDASVRTNLLESTAPIVPWIVSDVQYVYNLYFPGADDETDEIVSAGYPPDVTLDEVSDPTWNAKSYNRSVALTADRTVNSFVLQSNTGAGKENLGKGRTLTITSGGLILSNNNLAKLGNEEGGTSGEAGTVVFPNKAYVYSVRQSESQPNEIWAEMVSPNGAVFSYPGDLRIGGDQTGIDDHIAVNGMRLQLGSTTTGCEIDVPVHLHGTAKLSVNKEGSFCKQDLWFWDHGTTGSKFVPAAGTQEKVRKAYVDGVSVPRGVWGSSESSAPNVDDAHFAGTGTVKILKDDRLQPTILMVM